MPSDIPWCAKCFAPATSFAPRPVTRGDHVGLPRHDVRFSRWRRGPTSFGPAGRIAITVGLVVFLAFGTSADGVFSPWALWFFFGWAILAVVVLKQTWQPVPLDDARPPSRLARFGALHPVLEARIHVRVTLVAVVAVLAVGLALWARGAGTASLFAMVSVVVLLGVGAAVAWLSDL